MGIQFSARGSFQLRKLPRLYIHIFQRYGNGKVKKNLFHEVCFWNKHTHTLHYIWLQITRIFDRFGHCWEPRSLSKYILDKYLLATDRTCNGLSVLWEHDILGGWLRELLHFSVRRTELNQRGGLSVFVFWWPFERGKKR